MGEMQLKLVPNQKKTMAKMDSLGREEIYKSNSILDPNQNLTGLPQIFSLELVENKKLNLILNSIESKLTINTQEKYTWAENVEFSNTPSPITLSLNFL